MLINDKYKYAPSVEKYWKVEEKKRDNSPRHKEFMVWWFRTRKDMDATAESIIKIMPKEDMDHLEKGRESTYISGKFAGPMWYIRLEFFTRNPHRLYSNIKFKGMRGGYGAAKMYEPPKDTTNYMGSYKSTLIEINKQLDKLSEKELKNLGNNMKLRDLLIKRVKRKSTYVISTLDSWIIDEWEKRK